MFPRVAYPRLPTAGADMSEHAGASVACGPAGLAMTFPHVPGRPGFASRLANNLLAW